MYNYIWEGKTLKNGTFASRLAIALKDKNLKPVDLANKTGVDKSSISHYLSASYEPKSDKLLKIAEVLDVNETWLMGYDVPKERTDPLLNVNNVSLYNFIMSCSNSKIEQELLVKCTMLEEYNQAKILEIVNMYLKEQGDLIIEQAKNKVNNDK